jgi:hypothetical protein
MDWVEEMTARWVRILRTEDGDRTPVDEAVRQLNTLFEAPASGVRTSGVRTSGVRTSGVRTSGVRASGRAFGRRKRGAESPAEPAPVPAAADPAASATETSSADPAAVTALSRQLVVGVLVSDLMLDEVCAVTGRTRDQVLDQLLSGGLGHGLGDGRLRLLVAELSGSRTQLHEPTRGSYPGVGSRVEQLLGLAAEQAAALVDAARAEAAKITASPGPRRPCPNCGASDGEAQ